MAADPNHVILTGENPFSGSARPRRNPDDQASYWSIITCPRYPVTCCT